MAALTAPSPPPQLASPPPSVPQSPPPVVIMTLVLSTFNYADKNVDTIGADEMNIVYDH